MHNLGFALLFRGVGVMPLQYTRLFITKNIIKLKNIYNELWKKNVISKEISLIKENYYYKIRSK